MSAPVEPAGGGGGGMRSRDNLAESTSGYMGANANKAGDDTGFPQTIPRNPPREMDQSDRATYGDGNSEAPDSVRSMSRSRTKASKAGSGQIRMCKACDQPLEGQFVRALGGTFHLACFKCQVGFFQRA